MDPNISKLSVSLLVQVIKSDTNFKEQLTKQMVGLWHHTQQYIMGVLLMDGIVSILECAHLLFCCRQQYIFLKTPNFLTPVVHHILPSMNPNPIVYK